MIRLARIMFFGYVGVVILAGVWGMVFASTDIQLMFGLRVNQLPPENAATLLSQYRFLRALEFGFGLFCLTFRNQIFQVPTFNRLFLVIMGLGILGRLIGYVADGSPKPPAHAYAGYEFVAILLIAVVTRSVRRSAPTEPAPA